MWKHHQNNIFHLRYQWVLKLDKSLLKLICCKRLLLLRWLWWLRENYFKSCSLWHCCGYCLFTAVTYAMLIQYPMKLFSLYGFPWQAKQWTTKHEMRLILWHDSSLSTEYGWLSSDVILASSKGGRAGMKEGTSKDLNQKLQDAKWFRVPNLKLPRLDHSSLVTIQKVSSNMQQKIFVEQLT